jgi:hypothetical protein
MSDPKRPKKADYVYALEVAGQPASSAQEKKMRRKAKEDVKYLEEKYPKYTGKMKNFDTRHNINTRTKPTDTKNVSKDYKFQAF